MSVKIKSEISPLIQENEKKSTHSLTDIRACSFSHVETINLSQEFFEIHTFDRKIDVEGGETVLIND